jgi:hypothetical protein
VVHQFFDLSEVASTVVTLVPFKHRRSYLSSLLPVALTIVVVVLVVPSIPALSTEVAVYLPGRLRMVIEHA